MPNYRLTVEYDGARYSGWQEQQNARTVAGEIRQAAGRVAGKVLQLGGAGRTDSGVHALGQVAHLRLAGEAAPETFRRAVNDLLPADIHILAAAPAPDDFDSRRDALLRSYVYQIAVRRTALARRWVWWVKRPLDPARMEAAARLFVGRHDFAAFCERPATQKSTLVHLEQAEVQVDGGLILVRFAASHFLWKMVRRLVGTLVRVGAGEWESDHVAGLLEGLAPAPRLGTVAEGTAPCTGLFLERVIYEGEPPLGPLTAPTPVAAEPAVFQGRRPAAGAGARPFRPGRESVERGVAGPTARPPKTAGRRTRSRRP